MSDDEFEQQLRLEKAEKELASELDSGYSDPYLYTDPNDGTVYEWDSQKNAWFPKIDDNFLASYYGTYNTDTDATSKQPEDASASSGATSEVASAQELVKSDINAGEKRKASDPEGWFEVDDNKNCNVYVSNLPHDITLDEFHELMSKCGIVMKDIDTGDMKIKLYMDDSGQPKGDGLCCYLNVESVDLALNILDGSTLRDCCVHVERAKFQMKGHYDPTKKRKKKAKDKKKLQDIKKKLLDWRPDRIRGSRLKHEKVVVIKNMFDPIDFEKDASEILEFQRDLREECAKFGQVKKVIIYDRHPEGVASVSFAEPEEADVCIEALNGRWFASRKLMVATWDGVTKYKIEETEEQIEERMKHWDEFLDKEEEKKKEEKA